MSWSKNPSIRGLSSWYKRGPFSLYHYQDGRAYVNAVGQPSLKSLSTGWKASTMLRWSWHQWAKRLPAGFLQMTDERMSSSRNILAKDRFDQPVFLWKPTLPLRWFADKYPDVKLEEKVWLRYKAWVKEIRKLIKELCFWKFHLLHYF